jgi:hypothetical protein
MIFRKSDRMPENLQKKFNKLKQLLAKYETQIADFEKKLAKSGLTQFKSLGQKKRIRKTARKPPP